jgi:hypothetical protein
MGRISALMVFQAATFPKDCDLFSVSKSLTMGCGLQIFIVLGGAGSVVYGIAKRSLTC